MKHQYRITLTAACAAVLLSATAPGQWPGVHNGPNNNAAIAGTAVADLSGVASLSTAPEDLRAPNRVVVGSSHVYAVASQTMPDRIWIKSFDKSDLSLAAESADLDLGVSVSFGTASGMLLDEANDALYFANNATMYRLNASDLTTTSPGWSTVVSATNTSAAAGTYYSVLNASPSRGAGRIFMKTYPTSFGDTAGSQVVALDEITGAVAWYAVTGGRGSHQPLFVDTGSSQLVISERQVSGNEIGLQAFDANATGAATPVWTSAWTLTAGGFNGVWGDMMESGGKIYALTTDVAFPGPSIGFLIRVDATTGALEESFQTIGGDVPPVLIGGDLYVLQETGDVEIFDPANLTAGPTGSGSLGGFVFRNYWAGSSDSLYVAQSGSGLRRIDLTGALQSTSAQTDFEGCVSIDAANGHVYGIRSGALSVFNGTTSVIGWEQYH